VQEKKKRTPYISFSELKDWFHCPYYHKITRVDKEFPFKGNEFTVCGNAVHDVAEQIFILEHNCRGSSSELDKVTRFKKALVKGLKSLPKEHELKKELIKELVEQCEGLLDLILPSVEKQFGKDFKVIQLECKLAEPLAGQMIQGEYDFLGFIDAVFQTADGKYHIVDWKVTSWGWDQLKKSDKMTTYQLTLYKHFWSQKMSVDPAMIETYFALLKRTAKKDRVEIFRVTSGARKTQNALTLTEQAIYNIQNEVYIKKRQNCDYCHLNFVKCRTGKKDG